MSQELNLISSNKMLQHTAETRFQLSLSSDRWLSETGEYIAVYLSSLLSVSPQMKDSSFQTKLKGHLSQYTQDCLVKHVHAVLSLSSWCKLAAAFVSVGKANWKHCRLPSVKAI